MLPCWSSNIRRKLIIVHINFVFYSRYLRTTWFLEESSFLRTIQNGGKSWRVRKSNDSFQETWNIWLLLSVFADNQSNVWIVFFISEGQVITSYKNISEYSRQSFRIILDSSWFRCCIPSWQHGYDYALYQIKLHMFL